MANPEPVCDRRWKEGGTVTMPEGASAEAEAVSARCLSDAELDLVPGGRPDEAGAEALRCHWPAI